MSLRSLWFIVRIIISRTGTVKLRFLSLKERGKSLKIVVLEKLRSITVSLHKIFSENHTHVDVMTYVLLLRTICTYMNLDSSPKRRGWSSIHPTYKAKSTYASARGRSLWSLRSTRGTQSNAGRCRPRRQSWSPPPNLSSWLVKVRVDSVLFSFLNPKTFFDVVGVAATTWILSRRVEFPPRSTRSATRSMETPRDVRVFD